MNSRRIFGALVLIIGLGLCGKGLMLLFGHTYYEAVTKIKIQPDEITDVPCSNGDSRVYLPYDPYFMEMELKSIQSEIVLSDVVQALDLNVAWGKRYGDGKALELGETIKLLREEMVLSADSKTLTIEIRIRDKEPESSSRIANAIAKAYTQYRIEQYREEMKAGIQKLEEDYKVEETNIWMMQGNVNQLRSSISIHETPVGSPIVTKKDMQHYNELLIQAQTSHIKLQNQLAELRAIQATNSMKLREVLPAAVNDSLLSNLVTELHENEQKLAAETNSNTTSNADEVATRASITILNRQIDDRINGIMAALASNAEAQKAALDALNQRIQYIAANAVFEQTNHQPYLEAKRHLEEVLNLHQLLAEKIKLEKAEPLNPRTPLVTIVSAAVASQTPAGPNRIEGAGLLIGGLVLSVFGFFTLRGGNKKGAMS